MKLETFDDYKNEVCEFEKYLQENHPDFPKDIDKILLSKFLKACNRDFKESANLLRNNIDIRSRNKDLFVNRDFYDEKVILARNTFQFFHLPKITKDGALLSVHKVVDFDSKKFEIFDIIKHEIMAIDIVQGSMMNDELPNHEISILDGAGLSFKHLLKFMTSLWHIKVFLEFVQDAVPYYLKEIHVVNVSTIVKNIYVLLKPFIKGKTEIILHTTHDELVDIFDRDDLPEEYGGILGKNDELYGNYTKYLEKNVNVLKQYNFTK